MQKTLILSVFILLTVIGGTLRWQWDYFFDSKNQSLRTNENITQSIDINDGKKQLNITQTISRLQPGKYKVATPVDVKLQSIKQGNQNIKLQSNQLEIDKTTKGSLQFSYTIAKGMDEMLLDQWTFRLQETSIKTTDVQITRSQKDDGVWVAGTPVIDVKKKENAHYFNFSSSGGEFPLYYFTQSLKPIQITDEVTLFSENKKSQQNRKLIEEIKDTAIDKNLAIIMNQNSNIADQSDGLIVIANERHITSIKSLINEQKLMEIYPFANHDEQWMQTVLDNLATDKLAGGKKARQMTKSILSVLTESQKEKFVHSLVNLDMPLTSKIMDEKMGDVLNARSSFFAANANKNGVFTKFYIFDKRDIYVNGKKVEGGNVVYLNKKRFYDLEPLITSFDYRYIQKANDQIQISGNDKKYIFFPNKQFFMLNGKEYGLLSNPIRQLQGKVYMGERWLEEIFNVALQVSPNRFEVMSS